MMFGNLIFNHIVKEALEESHPTKDFEHCLNRAQHKHVCTACADICPEKVYFGKGSRSANFTACINCNLCVAACPARCIASSSVNASAWLKQLRSPEETVCIAARSFEGSAQFRADYPASLPWELLAALALCKKVHFLTDDYPDQSSAAQKLWEETLTRLMLFFGKEEFMKRFTFSSASEYASDPGISRRELLLLATDGVKRTVSSFVPSEKMMDGLLYRHFLKNMLDADSSGKTYGWIIPNITSACKGCGVCEKLCPQQALKVQKKNDTFQIIFYPVRCNGCQLCLKSCIHHAMGEFVLLPIRNLRPLLLYDSTEASQ